MRVHSRRRTHALLPQVCVAAPHVLATNSIAPTRGSSHGCSEALAHARSRAARCERTASRALIAACSASVSMCAPALFASSAAFVSSTDFMSPPATDSNTRNFCLRRAQRGGANVTWLEPRTHTHTRGIVPRLQLRALEHVQHSWRPWRLARQQRQLHHHRRHRGCLTDQPQTRPAPTWHEPTRPEPAGPLQSTPTVP